MIYYGTVTAWFDKMMILVAFFSWCAVGYCIMFNLVHILPFQITTNEMITTYFYRAVIVFSIVMVVSYLLAVRSWL